MSAGTKWLVAIVGLLAGNMLAVIILIGAAHTGGSRVIPSYYEKATRYDDDIDQAAKNRVLGWHVDATLVTGIVRVEVTDRDGTPITNARVHVIGAPRAERARPIDVELAGTGGEYRGAAIAPGLVDLTIAVDRGSDRFVQHSTVEAR